MGWQAGKDLGPLGNWITERIRIVGNRGGGVRLGAALLKEWDDEREEFVDIDDHEFYHPFENDPTAGKYWLPGYQMKFVSPLHERVPYRQATLNERIDEYKRM
ncbi:hypothetical protein V8E51_018024 [Hyaloscypha variabilis]